MTERDNTRILATAQAQDLNVATNTRGDTVVTKGGVQLLIRALQDGPGQPFAYDYLRVAEGGTWRVSAREALALVESGMTAMHLGKSVAELSPAELRQRIGGDRGSTRANRAAAYRQQGYSARAAREAACADEREAAAVAREPAWMKGLSGEEKGKIRSQEQANWRSRATADVYQPAPRAGEVATARMRQQTQGSWKQRLETAAARAARTLPQARERDSSRSR